MIELLIVVAIILIIAAIAVPNFMRSRMAANESAAVSYLRAINTASVTYSATYGNGFPPALGTLGPAGGPVASCNNADLLDAVLACAAVPCRKSGYDISYGAFSPLPAAAPGCAAAGGDGFVAGGIPVSVGTTGQRSFCVDHTGIIRQDPTGAAYGVAAVCPTAGPNSQPIG